MLPAIFLSGSSLVIVIRSILTYVVVALYVLVLGPPILLVAFVTKRPSILFGAGHIGVRLGLALSGVRMRVEGAEHLQRNRAAVYAVNHTSNVEPPIIFDVLSPLFPRLKILYKAFVKG